MPSASRCDETTSIPAAAGSRRQGVVSLDTIIASSNTVWILGGKGAAIMLPVLAAAVLVTLFVALRRDRSPQSDGGGADPSDPGVRPRDKNA